MSDGSADRVDAASDTSAEDLAREVFAPENLSCPHAVWAKLRAECPVPRIHFEHIKQDGFLVTRKDDIDFVASHPEIFTGEVDSTVWRWGNEFGPEFEPIFADGGYRPVHTIVTSDPPRAHKYRKIALEALSPKRVGARRADLQRIIDELIAAMPQDDTPFDFRDAFTVPLPLLAILDVFGLPLEDADFVYSVTCEALSLFDPITPIDTALDNARSLVRMQKYLAERIERYRAAPEDNFLSFVANARDAEGALLSMEEALSMAFVTLIGGNETTRNALTTAAYILATDQAMWRTLQADRAKVAPFAEEVVRFGSPATVTSRQTTQETELGGATLPKGAPVFIMWGSGSHDERVFEAPEELRLDRPNGRYHTSFGSGVHHCAGIHLARAELILSIDAWLDAFDRIDLAVPADEIRYEPYWVIRALEKLPVRITRKG